LRSPEVKDARNTEYFTTEAAGSDQNQLKKSGYAD
jgi:hypothetical protein